MRMVQNLLKIKSVSLEMGKTNKSKPGKVED